MLATATIGNRRVPTETPLKYRTNLSKSNGLTISLLNVPVSPVDSNMSVLHMLQIIARICLTRSIPVKRASAALMQKPKQDKKKPVKRNRRLSSPLSVTSSMKMAKGNMVISPHLWIPNAADSLLSERFPDELLLFSVT